MKNTNKNLNKIKIVFDLLGVITKEGLFATKVVYPFVQDKISYDLFKKKYLMYSLGIIEEHEFWEHISNKDQIDFLEEKILSKTEISPKINEIFCEFSKNDCDIYLATEIPRKWGELILKKAGLQNCFKQKFYSSDLKTTKPFEKFYDKVFDSLPFEKFYDKVFDSFLKNDSLAYYIEDTLINLIVAKPYGVTTIYLTTKEATDEVDVDYKITNVYDLLTIIV